MGMKQTDTLAAEDGQTSIETSGKEKRTDDP